MDDKDFFQVSLRGGFSDRNGIKSENVEMQYYDFDKRTRTALSNLIDAFFNETVRQTSFDTLQIFLRCVLSNIYGQEISISEQYNEKWVLNLIKQTIREDSYDSVLTIIEFLVPKFRMLVNNGVDKEILCNVLFKREYVGYRFVNHEIVAITDETEIAAINEALSGPYEFVNMHLSKALSMISDRDNPDYENSIKESISAVEALCEVITGTTGKEATLGNTLKIIEENGVAIHGALKSAFSALYGYTSDANGIRHAGDIGGPASTFEEAKFMLVSCSAFINYLIGVSAS